MKYLFCAFFAFCLTNNFAQEQFSLYFDSNKYILKKAETIRLNKWIKANNDIKVVGVYGFCDEDGSIEFNDTLAKNRINFIYNSIKSKIKFRDDFKTRNFGKLNNTSKIKAENRKVTLFFIRPKDFSREDEIIGIKKNEVIPIKKTYENLKFPDKLVFDNPDGTKLIMEMDTVFMKQINTAKLGEKLNLQNLNFIINTFAVVNESRAKMYELMYVLEKNSNLKIEIQGHLCCAKNDSQDLSTKRAKAIYNFLINQGIEKTRLSYKGFGVSEPIFPIPEKNETERAANRRVEILIIEN